MFSKVKNLFSTKFTKQKIILEKFNNFEQEVFWVLIAAGYNSRIYALLTLAKRFYGRAGSSKSQFSSIFISRSCSPFHWPSAEQRASNFASSGEKKRNWKLNKRVSKRDFELFLRQKNKEQFLRFGEESKEMKTKI